MCGSERTSTSIGVHAAIEVNQPQESRVMLNRKNLIGVALSLALGLAAVSASADVMVGGSALFPQKNITSCRVA